MATVFGPADEKSLKQLERCRDASGEPAPGVLCADHHLGYSMPIGGVIALKDKVMPAGVGYDIACGNCAVQTEIKADDLDTAKVMDEIASVLSFGVGRKNNETVDDPVIDMIAHAHSEGTGTDGGPGSESARHDRERQPLCGSLS